MNSAKDREPGRGQTGDPVYLKVKAVNFSATVFDTNDLSTIRGSSYALLRMPGPVERALHGIFEDRAVIDTIYAGASEAVFRLASRLAEDAAAKEADETALREVEAELESISTAVADGTLRKKDATKRRVDPGRRKAEIARRIRNRSATPVLSPGALATEARACVEGVVAREVDGLPLDELTFSTATFEPSAGDLRPAAVLSALETRASAARWARATVVVPPATPPSPGAPVCALDRVRPADPKTPKALAPMSRSVFRRREAGREQKQRFYDEELSRAHAIAAKAGDDAARDRLAEVRTALRATRTGFAGSFHDMLPAEGTGLPPAVAGKLAYVHIDGNGFAKRRADCGTFEALRRLSDSIALRRGLLLAEVLDWLLKRPDLVTPAGGTDAAFRLETLLWGGDESLWVMPAWCGWDFVGCLQRAFDRWWSGEGLWHATGVLFAPYNAPVAQMRAVADELSTAAKDKDPDSGESAPRNGVQVAALEGLDRAELSISALRAAFFAGPGAHSAPALAFTLADGSWDETAGWFATMRGHARRGPGKSQLHGWYREAVEKRLMHRPDGAAAEDWRKAVAELAGRMRRRIAAISDLSEHDAVLARLVSLEGATAEAPFARLHTLLDVWDYAESHGDAVAARASRAVA